MSFVLCHIFGHQPRGPVKLQPVLYQCDRCKQLIYFDMKKGWQVKRDD